VSRARSIRRDLREPARSMPPRSCRNKKHIGGFFAWCVCNNARVVCSAAPQTAATKMQLRPVHALESAASLSSGLRGCVECKATAWGAGAGACHWPALRARLGPEPHGGCLGTWVAGRSSLPSRRAWRLSRLGARKGSSSCTPYGLKGLRARGSRSPGGGGLEKKKGTCPHLRSSSLANVTVYIEIDRLSTRYIPFFLGYIVKSYCEIAKKLG
jgi:hypothetical protein